VSERGWVDPNKGEDNDEFSGPMLSFRETKKIASGFEEKKKASGRRGSLGNLPGGGGGGRGGKKECHLKGIGNRGHERI